MHANVCTSRIKTNICIKLETSCIAQLLYNVYVTLAINQSAYQPHSSNTDSSLQDMI